MNAATDSAVPSHDIDAAIRAVGWARRHGVAALETAVALDIAAPVAGRTWTACCVWCLDKNDPHAPSYRMNLCRGLTPRHCSLCNVSGDDVLVVALPT